MAYDFHIDPTTNEAKLIEINTNSISITEKGKPFVRNVCMAFDVLLKRKQPDTQLFSMTV